MQLVISARRAPAKTALIGLFAAVAAFVVLGIIGQSIPTTSALTGPAVAYWVLFGLFLLALLVAATAFGRWCGDRIDRRRAPLVATSGAWFTIASFFIGIMALGAEASWTDAVWNISLLGMIAGFVVGIVGLVASIRKLAPR